MIMQNPKHWHSVRWPSQQNYRGRNVRDVRHRSTIDDTTVVDELLPQGGSCADACPSSVVPVQVPEGDELSATRAQLLAAIDVALGGRVAEELTYGSDQVQALLLCMACMLPGRCSSSCAVMLTAGARVGRRMLP